MFV
ncbi:7aa67d62-1e85-46f0-ac6b-3f08a4e4939f [Thermothielavioides terrestris]|jgi:hypothetical protein